MEDAHAVGLGLLLEDGLSAGLASIQQELDRLDSVISAAGIGANVGRDSAAPPPDRHPLLVQAKEPPADQADAISTSHAATVARERDRLAPEIAAQPPSTAVTAALVPLLSGNVAPISTEPAAPRADLASVPAAPPAIVPPAAVGPLPVTPSSTGFTAAASLSFAAPVGSVSSDPTPATTDAAPAAPFAPIAPATCSPSEWLATPPDGPPTGRYAPIAPPPAPEASQSIYSRQDVPPSDHGEEGARPQEGRLILDGALLGRWVIDHLTREADRPASGGTAFDPRMGRTWPGALQGL